MAHEGPCGETGTIELECFPEVDDGFEMFSHEGVVVANDAACFRDVLVVVELFEGQIGQFPLILFDVEDVRVGVHVLEAEGVELKQLLEPL